MRILWIITIFTLVQCALGANIVALLPMPSKSHAILIERLLRHLDERGHTITYITPTLPQKTLGKVKIINIPDLKDLMIKSHGSDEAYGGRPNVMAMRSMSPWMMPFVMAGMGNMLMDGILQLKDVKNIIDSSEKFDLVLGEIFLDESILAGFAAKFKAPIVAVQTFMPGLWANFMVGNPAPSSFIPDPFLSFSIPMTFQERVLNFIFGVGYEAFYRLNYLPQQDAIMRKHFGSQLPPIENIIKNTSLVLVNHHFSIGFARPYVPNMIEIGGFHIDPPNPLPKDLQTYIDGSKDGVILFSLGSNAQSSDMPPEFIESLLKAFARLKQNILWKFETDLPNLPKNVKISKWLPQSDILAHPNVKLFITHGGLLSTTEAVERGVPVVGIPLFGDQPINMKHTENAGLGKTIQFDDITEDLVYNTVSEVINNPKYKTLAVEKSKLLNDNPMTAIDRALWWVEYVIRHKGAPHLRSAAQDLAWYQLHLLDVYAIVGVISLVGLAVNLCIIKWILNKIFCKRCCNNQNNVDKKKKKN